MITALERAIGEIVNARILGGRALGAVSIPYGSGCRTAITWKNLGAAGRRKVTSWFGHYNAETGEFTAEFLNTVEDVYIDEEATIITNVDVSSHICGFFPGTWDNLAAVGPPGFGTPDEADDLLVTKDAVIIEEKPLGPVTGQITGVSFSAR